MMVIENPCKACVQKDTLSCDPNSCFRYRMYNGGPKFGFKQEADYIDQYPE